MIWLLAAVSVFRDARPDQDGFQASWLYVLICLLFPAVLGVVMSMAIAAIERLVFGKAGKDDNGA
jgi:hypothetical protein